MPPEINSGDTAWVLAASALVMFMTPGLGFFYGGFTRSKNVLATIMQSFIVVGLVGIHVGRHRLHAGLRARPRAGIIGNLDFIGLKDVGIVPATTQSTRRLTYAPTIPHEAFMIFQAMFAIITPALITGAFAERAKFSTFLVFMVAWSLLVYDPVAHWVFGAGLARRSRDPERHQRARLRGRHRDPRQRRRRGARRRLLLRQAQGLRQRADGAAQHHLHRPRRGHPLVRLVRLQRRQRRRRQRPGRERLRRHEHGRRRGRPLLDVRSWALTGKPSVIGAAAGAVAGLVAITPGLRLRGAHGPRSSSAASPAPSATAPSGCAQLRRSTTRSTWSASTAWAASGARIATGLFATAHRVSGLHGYEGVFDGDAEPDGRPARRHRRRLAPTPSS